MRDKKKKKLHQRPFNSHVYTYFLIFNAENLTQVWTNIRKQLLRLQLMSSKIEKNISYIYIIFNYRFDSMTFLSRLFL